jgi:hypothetical protein
MECPSVEMLLDYSGQRCTQEMHYMAGEKQSYYVSAYSKGCYMISTGTAESKVGTTIKKIREALLDLQPLPLPKRKISTVYILGRTIYNKYNTTIAQ